MEERGPQTLLHISKAWGKEIWFTNNEKYCGKLIFVKDGEWSSNGLWHYHKLKDETFYVITGRLRLVVKIERDLPYYAPYAYEKHLVLEVGDSYRIMPWTKHKFSGCGCNCEFIEVSTKHNDLDSYRCEE